MLILLRREDAFGPVDADLRACGDAILPFPEFNHPGPSVVTEIDGLAVENHLKMDRAFIEE